MLHMPSMSANSPTPARPPELLAPAGSFDALQAALDAGSDAVYLGLKTLNARRAARNFSPDEFIRAVDLVHQRNARAYLTLNIDLAQRELGQAARILELAAQAKIDAVLVRDPALLALHPFYPAAEFHFSTQTCMASSADLQAAEDLGASRAVLARELTLSEIAAASAASRVQTEVFVQGALCFCISGRCLLSSWAGGRSGNRGACTSPCRVPWSIASAPAGTPLSMRDLCAVDRIEELRRAGVAALKIEGRLKTAAWVGKAVALFRRALDGEEGAKLLEEAKALGSYAGRQLTSAYLDGQRNELTALAEGRKSAGGPQPSPQSTAAEASDDQQDDGLFDFDLTVAERALACTLRCNERSIQWTMPRTVVHRAHKAVRVGSLLADLEGMVLHDCRLGRATTNDADFLLVPRAANALIERISSAVHQANRQPAEPAVRVELAEPVRQFLAQAASPDARSSANTLALGDAPDRVRLDARNVGPFLRAVRASGSLEMRPSAMIVENLTAHSLRKVLGLAQDVAVIAALPAVFFEEDIPAIRELLLACAGASLLVEVNSWGGWRLARQASLRMEGGPGLGVLNSLAAAALADRGIESATLSIEADRRQLEDVASAATVPLSMVVFGRPALLTSRAQLPREHLSRVFVDRREVKLVPRLERNLWTFRPPEPFDLRRVPNPRIRLAHLVVDLVASPDPGGEWLCGPDPDSRPFKFNYSRTLA